LITPLGKDEAAELQYKVGSIIRNVVGRLKPGITIDQATAELTVIQSRLPVPPFRPTISLKIQPLRAYLFGDVTTAGTVLLAAAGFLLLIACANVSNLLLARWMQRDRNLRSGRHWAGREPVCFASCSQRAEYSESWDAGWGLH
jgi:hypothetical protein